MKRKRSNSVIAFKPPRPLKKEKQSSKSVDHNILMKMYKQIKGSEKKYIDTAISAGYATTGLATITLINGVVQGTDENTRIGRQYTIHSIQVRGLVFSYANTSGTGLVRTIIVQDQEVPQVSGVGQVMAITDYLQTDALTALNNLNNRKRFKVLWSDVTELAGMGSNPGGTKTSHQLDFYKKVNINCEFNSANNGNIGDFTKNAIYIITYQYGLATTAPNCQINCRIRFGDAAL